MYNYSEKLFWACFTLFIRFFLEEFFAERIDNLPPKVKYAIFIVIGLAFCLSFSSA